MERVQDIFISDENLKSQYVDSFLSENYNNAFNLINNNNFKTKRITFENFQEISSKLYNLENLYFQNVPEFLDDKLNDVQNFIDNLIFLGEWNESIVYQAYNLVLYNNNTYLYIGENPYSGARPDLTTSLWLRLEIRGEKGAMGIGLNYRGIWNSSFSYNQYDSVFYNNSLWACKMINQNQEPQNGNYWDKIFTVYRAKIEDYSSITNQYDGLICFEIIQ